MAVSQTSIAFRKSTIKNPKSKFARFWTLIKPLQTSLLLATSIAGYMSVHTRANIPLLLVMAASLFLAIGGSTIMNMWYDHDIDSKMKRTQQRPAASGSLSQREILYTGMSVSIIGIGWSLAIDLRYGVVVFAGWLFDVVVYTLWLKRRTCWSIVWGGISGAMPILAGRVLAVDEIDVIGLLLASAILFWIPTHILTFSIKYAGDYAAAGVPTFPSTYGLETTRSVIALSSIIAAASMGVASVMIGVQASILRLLIVLSSGLLLLSFTTVFRPSERVNFSLFKYASLYMLISMILLSI